MKLNKLQKKLILSKCAKSFVYFCENFCKIKHPNAGIINFKLFKYQKKSVKTFKKYDRVIYRKCRQSGISTLTGAYALWVAMFFPNRKVLIVSKRDEDAIGYLNRNVKFVYEYLPEWMHEIFGDPRATGARKFAPPKSYNEHTIEFFHGSDIKSLTSSKDTLRSNTASLVIIDEAAFIAEMEAMWTAGQPTLMHGGRVIVISTTNGKGNWYHNTWDDAVADDNGFKPIQIPWYHMDWVLEWYDDLAGKVITLSPCHDIVRCDTKEDKLRYGEFKSPWLEQQYRELQEKGEPWKFRQEILMEFIGAGNTVINQESLVHLEKLIDSKYKVLQTSVRYKNDNANIHGFLLDFQKCLHIWETPVRKTKDIIDLNGKIITPGNPGHRYSLGADISSGEANDFSAIEIVDVTAKRQVAELKIKCETSDFAIMIDYLGRYYNNALVIVDSTGIGKPVSQDLKSKYYYPNLFYRRMPSGKKDKKPGFPISNTSKSEIVKALTDNLGIEDDGILFRSARLAKEANAFIHLGNNRVGNEPGTNNNDDLMIAAGLSLIGIMEAMQTPDGLIPTSSQHIENHIDEKLTITMEDIMEKGGRGLMYPIAIGSDPSMAMNVESEIARFIGQMNAGISPGQRQAGVTVSKNKYFGN